MVPGLKATDPFSIRNVGRGLNLQKPNPPKIVFGPADIRKHGFQRSDGKRIAERMVGNHHASAAGMPVDAMAAAGPCEAKTFLLKRPDEPACGESARAAGHKLTATAGVGHSTAPCSGSTGIASPASRRSST